MEYEKEIGLDKEGNLRAYINYQNPHKIYNFALEMHGKDRMSRPHTWVYNLSSPQKVTEVIENGGEYILLRHQEKPIGLVCFCFGVSYRPLNNPKETVTIDEWEVGSLLIHKEFRGKGYSRLLFKLAIKRLEEEEGVDKMYVIVTGTFDRERLGEPREISKGVVTLCKEFNGKLIGYAEDSFGPVFRLDVADLNF